MKRLVLTLSLLALSLGLPSALLADPGGPNLQQPVSLTCTGDRQHVVVTPGTLTNQGRVAWDTNSASVFVTSYLAFTNGTVTQVLFDSKPGLKNLVTCMGDAGGGFTVIAIGFFTPR